VNRQLGLFGLPLAIMCILSAACEPLPRAAAADMPLDSLVAELLPAAARLSGMPALSNVGVSRTVPAAVQRHVESRLERFFPDGQLDRMQRAYAMLGLIPDTLSLRSLLLELYGEQVAGYYDPEAKTLYVVDTDVAGPIEPVLVHELVHAIQDQHVDLDSLITQPGRNDRQTAAQAAIEGQAMLAMVAWLAESATGRPVDPATLPDPGASINASFEGSGAFPVFRRAPRIIRELLLFPYAGGAAFVQALWRAGAPDRTPPFGAFLPASTEQILHPVERFLSDRDDPTEIRHDAVRGWTTVYDNTLGAFEVGVLLDEVSGESDGARGWDGDRYSLYESESDTALVWTSIWDDAATADRFDQRIRSRAGRAGRRTWHTQRLDIEGRPAVRVTVTGAGSVAPDPASHCVDNEDRRTPC
jgi:hypothetical protein